MGGALRTNDPARDDAAVIVRSARELSAGKICHAAQRCGAFFGPAATKKSPRQMAIPTISRQLWAHVRQVKAHCRI
jgi:hypothetical protein